MSGPVRVQNDIEARHSEPTDEQENEIMFLDAMYGQDDPASFGIVHCMPDITSYIFYRDDVGLCTEEAISYVVYRRIIADSPNPISQLSVRLHFLVPTAYPLTSPIVACSPLMGITREQCMALIEYLRECSKARIGQVMLFDLFLSANEWLNVQVQETHQGSLYESMTDPLKAPKNKDSTATEGLVLTQNRQSGGLENMSIAKEAELRKQWLQKNTSSSRPLNVDTHALLSNNLSHTLSRFTKTQGFNAFRVSPASTNSNPSMLQALSVMQAALGQQQVLVAHLLSQWLELTSACLPHINCKKVVQYLEANGLVDSMQVRMIHNPDIAPIRAMISDPSVADDAIRLLLAHAPDLSQLLHKEGTRSSANRAPKLANESSRGNHGEIVSSRYEQDFEELHYLGSGAFGDVWKVRNRLDGIIYAIKRVRIGTFNDSESGRNLIAQDKVVNRILREVTTLGRIHSPYVLRYHQAWIEESEGDSPLNPYHGRPNFSDNTLRSSSFFEGRLLPSLGTEHALLDRSAREMKSGKVKNMSLYIQTAYCPKTLADFMVEEGRTATVPELWRLCRMMLEGLAHIHSHGIMHRDLKPSNIFIDSNGDIRIGDFGLATFEKGQQEDTPALDCTHGNELGCSLDHSRRIGTKLYASPEQEGEIDQEYDERTDIYSLGVIFFELWHPFTSTEERIQHLLRLKDGTVPPLFADSHPRQLRLISTMMNRSVTERPTATALLQSDLLPPRMEDDFLNDALRAVSNPNTPVFPRILAKLFSQERPPIISKPFPTPPIPQSLTAVAGYIPENLVLEQRRQWVCEIFTNTFSRHGAIRVSPPVLASSKQDGIIHRGDEASCMDTTGAILTMRYDTRSFFCQAMSDAYSNPMSTLRPDILFKRYDVGPVFRKAPREGYLPVEILKGDFDILGVDPVGAEAECLCVVSEIASRFSQDVQWVRIRLNHVLLYQFILDEAEIPQGSRGAVSRALVDAMTSCAGSRIDRWDTMRKALMAPGIHLTEKQLNVLGKWSRTSIGSVSDTITSITGLIDDDSPERVAIGQIEQIMETIGHVLGSHYREKELMLDICSPSPSEEYNGIFFRVDMAFNSAPDVGEHVATGGRLDNALKKYPDVASCQLGGISWNVSKFVTRVTVPPSGMLSSPDVLIGCLHDSKSEFQLGQMRMEQMALAMELWRNGVSADIFYGASSLQEQLEFAITRGVLYFLLIREKDVFVTLSVDGIKRKRVDDFPVSIRILSGGKSKQTRESFMSRTEVISALTHRTDKY